jgi:lysophospholipase L1-like esterase
VLFGIDGNNASDYGTTASNVAYRTVNIANASNIAYVRFSAWKNYKRVTGCSASYVAPWKNHAEQLLGDKGATYADKKILVIGDSISSDAYGNYKKWVTNLVDEGKFALSNVTNSSQHATGFVARYSSQNPDDFITRIEAITDKSTYDLVVVFGGINDYIQNVPLGGGTGETDKTVYFKPAVDYFFDYLVNNFTQARICVLLPLRNYNVYPNTAGNKQEVYSQYIHDVAKSYCLPVLNLTEESGFFPFNDTFKQMWTLIPSGYTAPDGTHPNAEYEKKYLAPIIWKFISGLLN